MRKSLLILAAAATVATATVAGSHTAEARGRWFPGAVIGGLAAGAIIGGAIANSRYYNGAYYGGGGGYYAAEPVYEQPACGVVTRRYWDGYGWRVRRYSTCDGYAPPPEAYDPRHHSPSPAP